MHQPLKPPFIEQYKKEEEVLDDKYESLPRAYNFNPAIESTDGAAK